MLVILFQECMCVRLFECLPLFWLSDQIQNLVWEGINKSGKTYDNRMKKEGKRSISDEDIKMDNSRVVKNRERRKQLTSPSPTSWTERKMERERKMVYTENIVTQEVLKEKNGRDWKCSQIKKDRWKWFDIINYSLSSTITIFVEM